MQINRAKYADKLFFIGWKMTKIQFVGQLLVSRIKLWLLSIKNYAPINFSRFHFVCENWYFSFWILAPSKNYKILAFLGKSLRIGKYAQKRGEICIKTEKYAKKSKYEKHANKGKIGSIFSADQIYIF